MSGDLSDQQRHAFTLSNFTGGLSAEGVCARCPGAAIYGRERAAVGGPTMPLAGLRAITHIHVSYQHCQISSVSLFPPPTVALIFDS